MKKMIIASMLFLVINLNVNAITVTGKSAILMDMNSKRIIYEKDINTRRLIASITKIMTCVIALENGNLTDVVTVGEEVLTMYGSNIYLALHEQMTLENLLYGLMLRSGNDAAIVIATYIGGSEENFVKMMNKKAKEIGMLNTTYNNSHGLDEVTENYSTAYDMAVLSSYAMENETYQKIVSTKKHTVQSSDKSYLWENRNKLLLNYQYATGGKTGYTPRAGRTLVTTASNNSLDLTAVTLNDGGEYTSHRTMYEYAFNNYENVTILDKGYFNISDEYFKDKVYLTESLVYPLKDREEENIKIKIILNKIKDYKNNDVIGLIKVFLYDEEIFTTNIYVRVYKTKTIWERIKDWFNAK